jgi:hypothetical protein
MSTSIPKLLEQEGCTITSSYIEKFMCYAIESCGINVDQMGNKWDKYRKEIAEECEGFDFPEDHYDRV